jgi:hypothetical protein
VLKFWNFRRDAPATIDPRRSPGAMPATLILTFLTIAAWPCRAQGYQHNVSQSWSFTATGNSLGWTPIAPLTNFGVSNGALTFTATATTDIVYSSSFSVPTAPMQLVEIAMRSNTAGASKVFWAPA